MAEKKTQWETEKKALQDWATQNGIDVRYLMGGLGRHRGRGWFGGPMKEGIDQ